jgi:hypothetical protein
MRMRTHVRAPVEKSHGWSRKAVLLAKYRQGNALEAAGSACEAWPLAERKTSQLANTWQLDTKSELRDHWDAAAGMLDEGALQSTMTPAASADCGDGSQKRLQECLVRPRTMR